LTALELRTQTVSCCVHSKSTCAALTVPHNSYIWGAALLDADTGFVSHRNANDSPFWSDVVYGVDNDVAYVDSRTGDFTPDNSHGGYCSLSDLALDTSPRVPVSNPQTNRFLAENEHPEDAQDESKLSNLWSPRSVSENNNAAEDYMHTEHPDFDLWIQDVEFTHAGQIEQPNIHLQTSPTQYNTLRIPSELNDCQRRLRIVRHWLSDHASRPYPTRTERAELAASAGCSVHQLNICFRNIRARQKHCKPVLSSFDYPADVASSVWWPPQCAEWWDCYQC